MKTKYHLTPRFFRLRPLIYSSRMNLLPNNIPLGTWLIVVGLLKSPATICLVSSKIAIVDDFTLWCDARLRNCRFNVFFTRLHSVYFKVMHVRQNFSCFIRKYTNNRWGVVYAVCASSGTSPFRQQTSACTEVRLEGRIGLFIHIQYSSCPLVLFFRL